MTDPTKIVKDVLAADWSPGVDVLDDEHQPPVTTGGWDRSSPYPVVSCGQNDEAVVSGGQTGYTGWNGATGEGVQRLQGYVLVNAVAGTRDSLRGARSDGEDANPKHVRSELYTRCRTILTSNQSPPGLKSLAPTSGESLVADDEGPPVYYKQFRARYVREPEQ